MGKALIGPAGLLFGILMNEYYRIAKAEYQTGLGEKAFKAFDDAMDPIRNMVSVFMAGEEGCVHMQTGELIQTLMEKAEMKFARVLREGNARRQDERV